MVKRLIVGLGNPGNQYANTRHNFGARVVEFFSRQNSDVPVLLPQAGVFMNDFGQIVPRNRPVILVHDDLELPLGEIQFVESGSAKGHNGVRSVQAALNTQDIPRLRLGIGRPSNEKEVSDYVLEKFSTEEEKVVERVVGEAVNYLTRLAQ